MAILSFLQQQLFPSATDTTPPPATAPRRPVFKPDRASLARRSRPGKEGSRRRQRYDNDHFVHHKHAVLDLQDLQPPGYPIAVPTWHFLPQHLSLPVLMPSKLSSTTTQRIDKAIQRELKRSHHWTRTVHVLDTRLQEFISSCTQQQQQLDDDWEWVSPRNTTLDQIGVRELEQDDSFRMIVQVEHAFVRKLLHAMCKFYHLNSGSKDVLLNGRSVRLTYVWWCKSPIDKMAKFTDRVYL